MNTLIVLIAQYLLYLLLAAAAVVWLTRDPSGRLRLGVEAVAGLALVGIGIWLAAHLHTDPRPFVHDPNSTPLFPHPADNGFPSDHSAAAGLLAALLLRWQVAVGAAAIAWSRVAAHVHHGQDVLAGLAIGVAAALLAIALVRLLARAAWFGRLERRGVAVRRSGRPATGHRA